MAISNDKSIERFLLPPILCSDTIMLAEGELPPATFRLDYILHCGVEHKMIQRVALVKSKLLLDVFPAYPVWYERSVRKLGVFERHRDVGHICRQLSVDWFTFEANSIDVWHGHRQLMRSFNWLVHFRWKGARLDWNPFGCLVYPSKVHALATPNALLG